MRYEPNQWQSVLRKQHQIARIRPPRTNSKKLTQTIKLQNQSKVLIQMKNSDKNRMKPGSAYSHLQMLSSTKTSKLELALYQIHSVRHSLIGGLSFHKLRRSLSLISSRTQTPRNLSQLQDHLFLLILLTRILQQRQLNSV